MTTPKETIDVACDECPAKHGEWCLRKLKGKWIRRAEGFHASRVTKARSDIVGPMRKSLPWREPRQDPTTREETDDV